MFILSLINIYNIVVQTIKVIGESKPNYGVGAVFLNMSVLKLDFIDD